MIIIVSLIVAVYLITVQLCVILSHTQNVATTNVSDAALIVIKQCICVNDSTLTEF